MGWLSGLLIKKRHCGGLSGGSNKYFGDFRCLILMCEWLYGRIRNSGGGQEGRFDGFAYGEESDVIWKIFGLLCCMQELILTKICGSESAEMGLDGTYRSSFCEQMRDW